MYCMANPKALIQQGYGERVSVMSVGRRYLTNCSGALLLSLHTYLTSLNESSGKAKIKMCNYTLTPLYNFAWQITTEW